MQHGDIGNKIRKLRKENGDTLKELARKVDYDWSNLSKVERGTYGLQLDLLKKIAEVYHISPNYFFGDSFTEEEGELLTEKSLSPTDLEKKYTFEVDGVPATDKEIEEAIRLIRYFRGES